MANILICDDEPNIRSTIRDILIDEGHKTFESESGLTGLTVIRENNIDIAIIDIWMPGLTGLDMIKSINKMDLGIIVILISGHGKHDDMLKDIEPAPFDFIEKPISLDNLLNVVENALKYKEMQS